MNLTVINALLDDLGQSGFQLTDQMFEILMVEKGFSLSAFCFSGGILLQKMVKNVSPEETGKTRSVNNRLLQEILVRESNGVIEAEIFPDYEYAKKKEITEIQAGLQEVVNDYNKTAPAHKRVYSLKVRETEFEKNTFQKNKKILRNKSPEQIVSGDFCLL